MLRGMSLVLILAYDRSGVLLSCCLCFVGLVGVVCCLFWCACLLGVLLSF